MHVMAVSPDIFQSCLLPPAPARAVGVLLAQSRWSRPLRKPLGGKASWFWLHLAINVAGVALVIAAYGIAST